MLHRARDRIERDDDRSRQLIEQRPHRLEHRFAAGAVDERRPPVREVHGTSRGNRRRQRRSGLGLGCIHPHVRLQLAYRRRDARQQSAAAERRDDRVDVRKILEDFEPRRRVAGDEPVVVERMNEMAGHPIRSVRLDGPPAFVVRRAHDGGAEAFDRANLRIGRRVHHHHRAARADFPCGEGDALSRVAGAHGPHAFAELLRRQLTDHVIRAADLERADWLKHFELQVDLGLRVRRARSDVWLEPDERRADRGAVHGERGVADGGERNAATRNRDGQGG